MRRVVVITAGRGPVECRRAVKAVVTAFVAEAEEAGLGPDVVPGHDPDGEGPVSARVVFTDAVGLDGFLSSWRGTVQYVSRSERRGRKDRKNWFIGVREEKATDESRTVVDPSDVEFSAMAAGGPGGQHVNKTASAVRALHKPSGITVVVRSERSQHQNKRIALDRIASVIDERQAGEKMVTDRREWSGRIQVERGNPVRTISPP